MKRLLIRLVAISVAVYFFINLAPQLLTMGKEVSNDYSQVTGIIMSIDSKSESYDTSRPGISPRFQLFSIYYKYTFDDKLFTSRNFSISCDWCREGQMKKILLRDSQKLEVGSEISIHVNKFDPKTSWILRPTATEFLSALLYFLGCVVFIPLFIHWFACLWLSPLGTEKSSESS